MSNLPDWLVALISIVIPGFGAEQATIYNGYVEGDFVYVAPKSTGQIIAIHVSQGQQVENEQPLFDIDDAHQLAALRSAEAQVAVAQANLDNLSTGSRSAEIDVIRATLDQALADQALAGTTLERTERLFSSGSVSQSRVDAHRAALQSADAHVAQLRAQLQVAELPARDSQIIAAEASHEAALAQLDDALVALADRKAKASSGGLVEKVFYDVGEIAVAGSPILSILPPDSLTALFFIPEADRATVQPGDVYALTCNGCAPGLTAEVTRLAANPQYTPPIIYSREERSRLVFRAEADIRDADGLLPGQPISLSPQP